MTEAVRVLVVDDQKISRHSTRRRLRAAGYAAEAVESAYAALDRLEAARWDVVIIDLGKPRIDSLALMREAKRLRPETDVILVAADGTVEHAVAAIRQGAADYLTRPLHFPELEARLRRLGERRASRRNRHEPRPVIDDQALDGIRGQCSAIRRACDIARLFADSPAPVLVAGEVGTGKNSMARAIHDLGPRKSGPFVAAACRAMPRELAAVTFFGRENASSPEDAEHRRGLFDLAAGGTLLLDDVEGLAPDLQAKVLRVLEEGTFRRIGGESDLRLDARVIATTSIDLGRATREKQFLDDLFYRLRGLEVRLPPLRERGDDVLLLAQHFLSQLASATSPAPTLSAEAADLLRACSWPGNVRELRRVLGSAFALSSGSEIRPEHLPECVRADEGGRRPFALRLETQARVLLPDLVREFEAEVIQWAMRRAQGQQTLAARLLGVPRTTLQSKHVRPLALADKPPHRA